MSPPSASRGVREPEQPYALWNESDTCQRCGYGTADHKDNRCPKTVVRGGRLHVVE